MAETEQGVFTVSELNRCAKDLLEVHLNMLWVEGEISNYTRASSGHWYFTLKDDGAQIRCAMFRGRNALCRTQPKHGDLVRVRGRVSLYEARGDYQMIVEHLKPSGEGALQQKFEALKLKLQAEGLFDSEHKQALPAHPAHIGIITSATAAALQDALKVFRRRHAGIQLTLIPASVQGQNAAVELIGAIELAQKSQLFDALLLTRGGGSLEDLWSFNDEALARCIYRCSIPIVSAVGHEIDFSIADFVADVRAPTPSAGAEILSPDLSAQINRLNEKADRLKKQGLSITTASLQKLQHLRARLRHPREKIEQWQQRLDYAQLNLVKQLKARLNEQSQTLEWSSQALLKAKPNTKAQLATLKQTTQRLNRALPLLIQSKKNRLCAAADALDLVSPLATLKRGYSITMDKQARVIKSRDDIKHHQELTIKFADGSVNATANITKE